MLETSHITMIASNGTEQIPRPGQPIRIAVRYFSRPDCAGKRMPTAVYHRADDAWAEALANVAQALGISLDRIAAHIPDAAPAAEAFPADRDDPHPTRVRIRRFCRDLCETLLKKNRAYGDTAIDPPGIFYTGGDPEAALRVRIDDKLGRLARQPADDGEDTLTDLIGYLVLLHITRHPEPTGGAAP